MDDAATALVESFAGPVRYPALEQLQALGPDAIPAVRAGLKHPDWHVRHWCAIYMDRVDDPDLLRDLVPLLTDSEPRVRLWAVHSMACEHCKAGSSCPIDVVPLLVERIDRDPSLRVRKMAVCMLATLALDSRIPPVFRRVLDTERDAKIRLHADLGLEKYREAGRA